MPILKTADLNSYIYQDALTIRKNVFIKEQQIPLIIEISEENTATYFVYYNHFQQPLGTCRIQLLADYTYKIQRFAVLKNARNQKIGSQLLKEVETFAQQKGIQAIELGAQCSAQSFYEKLGYLPSGDSFMEAGIPHQPMKKELMLY